MTKHEGPREGSKGNLFLKLFRAFLSFNEAKKEAGISEPYARKLVRENDV